MATPKSDGGSPVLPESVDVHAAKELVRSGHKYLDVRTVEEFNKGHVQGAINAPYWHFTARGRKENPKFLEEVSAVLDKDDSIVVACASGGRSIRAAADMLKAGFKNVKNMKGGYTALVKNGLVDQIPSKL